MAPTVAQLCLLSQPTPTKQGLDSKQRKIVITPRSTPPWHGSRKRKADICFSGGKGLETTPLGKALDFGAAPLDRSTPPKVDPRKASLRVSGPMDIQTLRGQILGREVALIICGEAHENAIDLTRRNSVVLKKEDWMERCPSDRSGFAFRSAVATKRGITLKAAKYWAKKQVTQYVFNQSEPEKEDDGNEFYTPEQMLARNGPRNYLMFVPENTSAGAKGVARIFARPLKPSSEHPLPANAHLFELGDTDEQARFNRLHQFTDVPLEKQDAIIDERKLKRLEDGFELFDDWLIRHMSSNDVHVEFLSEAPVKPEEVEEHVTPGARRAPLAHKCLREIGMDEGVDSGSDEDDGTGAYADYLQRRVEKNIPSARVHGIDPRVLGTESMYEHLASKHVAKDAEESLLKKLRHVREPLPPVVPSWEAFFGIAAGLLYYSEGVKVDFAPFLHACVGSAYNFRMFFKELYFGTLPSALAKLQINPTTLPMIRIRSSTCDKPRSSPVIRGDVREIVPIQAAPFDRCLKSRASEIPRTWVSALLEQLRCAGAIDLAAAAEAWYMDSVAKLLADPKAGDSSGDYFAAWLRECHSDIYEDIDASDPLKMLNASRMYSFDQPPSKRICHNLKNIKIPSLDEGFDELKSWDPEKRASNCRERTLAQIYIDAYQLRLVDLSAVLKMAAVTLSAPKGKPVAVVLYAGEDHTRNVSEFWRSHGFGHDGLPNKGYVGKKTFKWDETRALSLPSYLHDLGELFRARA